MFGRGFESLIFYNEKVNQNKCSAESGADFQKWETFGGDAGVESESCLLHEGVLVFWDFGLRALGFF